MNALKNLFASLAATFVCATPAFAQLPFGTWPVANPIQCQNGVCFPANNTNAAYYGNTPMNCQNGVCTPAYGNFQQPAQNFGNFKQPAPVRNPTPTTTPVNYTNGGNSPFFSPNGPNSYYGVPQAPIQSPTQNWSNQTPRLNIPANMSGIAQLPVWEQEAALKQRICPVSGDLLGSRGVPIRTVINGQSVFVCCQNCQSNPGYYTNSPLPTTPQQPWFNMPQSNPGYGFPGQANNQNYVLY